MKPLARIRLSRFQVNLLTNLVGKGWVALIALAFVPVYIRFLGIEAYGLIGLFAALQAMAQLLDLGISPTVNRELARYSALSKGEGEARDLVRSLEIIAWPIGFILGAVTYGLAPWIAASWIRAETIPIEVLQQAIQLMGIVLALQWPLGLYYGGLIGLQRQALSNSARIVTGTLAALGSVAVLLWISADILTFFRWQAVISAGQVLTVMFLLWRSLPPSGRRPRVVVESLRRVRRFAAGMTGVTITSIVATQLDKVILSSLLSLEAFGYYALAGVIASGLRIVVTPVFDALFPRLSALIAIGDEEGLRSLYHRGAQLMSTLVLPLGLVLALFSYEVVKLWTGDPSTAEQAAPLVTALVIGTALNALWFLPYSLQLASGWTGLAVGLNTVLATALIPALFILTERYGAVGAASAWPMLNGAGVLASSVLTHRRLLKGEWGRWLGDDLVRPLIGATAIIVAVRLLVPRVSDPVLELAVLFGALIAGMILAAVFAPSLRSWALVRLSTRAT